jgi:hypothetical protein
MSKVGRKGRMMSKRDGKVASAGHKTSVGALRTALRSVIEQSYVNHREAMRLRGAFT